MDKMKYLMISLMLACLACSKVQMDDCITSAGPVAEQQRALQDFQRIHIEDKLQLILVQDSVNYVKISGPQNLLGQISTEVEDGQLRFENRNTCNFVRDFDIRFQLELHFIELSDLHIESAAEVSSVDSLRLDDLNITHAALSDIDLKLDVSGSVFVQSFNSAHTRLEGRAKTLRGSIEEVSDLDARSLRCQEVILDHHSPLDCYVDGREIIFVKIYNSGNIYYLNEPSNYKDLNFRRGSGDLIRLQ